MTWNVELLDRLSQWRRGSLCALFVSLTLLVAAADYLTGERYTVYILYFPIIALACWLVGLRLAIVISMAGSVLWILDDYLTPPAPLPELFKYWQAIARFAVFAGFAYVLSRLRTAMMRERYLSRYDALTGLENRSSLFEFGQRDVARCRRAGRPLTAVFIDVDKFKQVNDGYGHAEGDKVLRATADIIRKNTRETDLTARIGGDEFVVVAPEMGYGPAQQYIRRLQQRLDEAVQHRGWDVTFSIGAATFNNPPASLDEIVKAADDLMYQVKHGKKNAVQHRLFDAPPTDQRQAPLEFAVT